MGNTSFFFAGGGTGGHIYPLLAVAEQLREKRPDAEIHFFHSTRAVDQRVFEKTGFARTPLPASGLYAHPVKLLRFALTFQQSCKIAMQVIAAAAERRGHRGRRFRRGSGLSGGAQARRPRRAC